MPCFRCGTRQTDPEHEPSPWRRAVRDGHQILVCPDCQDDGDWRDSVDACPSCGSLDLTRRLGQTVCTCCLALVHDVWIIESPVVESVTVDATLVRDVADAIERTLGRA